MCQIPLRTLSIGGQLPEPKRLSTVELIQFAGVSFLFAKSYLSDRDFRVLGASDRALNTDNYRFATVVAL